MAHARLAFQLGYGTPTVLVWAASFYSAGLFDESRLRYMRWTAVIVGIGFYLRRLRLCRRWEGSSVWLDLSVDADV